MRKILLTTTALFSLSIGMALANVTAEQVVQDLQTQGYTSIEVYVGPTQIKAEGYQAGSRIEVIRDIVTGVVLKQEIEALSPDDLDDDNTPGIEIEDVPFDFLDSEGNSIKPDDDDDIEDDLDEVEDEIDDVDDDIDEDGDDDTAEGDDDHGGDDGEGEGGGKGEGGGEGGGDGGDD